MRNFILSVFLAVMPALSFAQEVYNSFLEEGKVWSYKKYNYFTGDTSMRTLIAKGDTIVGDVNYKKIADSELGFCYSMMREDAGRVYCRYHGGDEFLVYDFSLKAGDSFNAQGVSATVVAVDTIVVGGRVFRALDVRDSGMPEIHNWWVKGIGSMYGFTVGFQMPGNYSSFLSCQLGDDVLFAQKDFVALGVGATDKNPALPLVEEGRKWHVASLEPVGTPQPGTTQENLYRDLRGYWGTGIPSEYTLKGDTMMNGQAYKRLIDVGAQRFECGLRQDGNRVYRCDAVGSPEYLVFDFDMQPGDVMACPYSECDKLRVGSVETVSVNGVARRVLKILRQSDEGETSDEVVDIWIEGIGCMGGPVFTWWWTAIGLPHLLVDCYQEDQKLFSCEDVSLQQIADVRSLSIVNGQHSASAVYDLQGRRLNGEPRSGVYIRDGKKYVKH